MTSNASDAPVRRTGIHTRSGNAMMRTRLAILDAAAKCVETQGVRKTTMSDVSTSARIAKATLYNHFRTKNDLLAALVRSRIEQLTSECSELAGAGLDPALQHAGRTLSASAPLRRLADEPAALALLATPRDGPMWALARSGVATVLREAGAPSEPAAVDLVLRWLCAHLLSPASEAELRLAARVLTDGLGRAPLAVPTEQALPERPVAGVGWPG